MNKVLPINPKPSVITCIHEAYPCAIIESKELAVVEIDSYPNFTWDFYEEKVVTSIEKCSLTVLENDTKGNAFSSFWREMKSEDEIIVKINYFKPRDIGRYIDVFIFNDNIIDEINCEDKKCGIRWNPYGLFIGKDMFCYDTKTYIYLKVCVSNGIMIGYTSRNGNEWTLIDKRKIPSEYICKNNKIGIHIYCGENSFIPWKNMNFIQLIFNEENTYKGIFLDYYFFPRKNVDNSYGWYLNFLDTDYQDIYEILDCFKTVHDYLHWCIDHFYYVELCLDEYYIPDRFQYKKNHYNHYNLFYGYDDLKKIYYIMGYGKNSIPVITEIPFELLKSKIITSEKIMRYRYRTNDVTNLRFNIKPIIIQLYNFLYGKDSGECYSNFLTEEKLIFGLPAIHCLANSDFGRARIREDKRVSFCLMEHSKLMRERLIYLYENGYVELCKYRKFLEQNDKLISMTSLLLKVILKNDIKPVESKRIDDLVMEIHGLEQSYCKELLCYLNRDEVIGYRESWI